MLFKKQGFPEEGDLVLCTVTSVQFHSVFVDMDEFGRGGMIHISELKDGYVKKVEDVIKLGDFVRAKVVKVENGKIGLSLKAMK